MKVQNSTKATAEEFCMASFFFIFNSSMHFWEANKTFDQKKIQGVKTFEDETRNPERTKP